MPRQRSLFYYIIAIFCILGAFELFRGVFGLWPALLLTLPLSLLLVTPPFVHRRLGHMVGAVKRAYKRHNPPSTEPRDNDAQFYAQGYQVNVPDPAQEWIPPRDSYEAPQAHYPSQLPPM